MADEDEVSRSFPRRWLKTILRVGVSLALVGFVLSQVGVEPLLQSLSTLSVGVFVAAIALSVLNVCLSVWKWQLLLAGVGYRLTYGRLFVYYYIGQFFNFFLPSAIGGDTVRAYYLHKELDQGYDAASSVVVERVSGLVAIMLMAIPATLLLRDALPDAVVLTILAAGVFGLLLLVGFFAGVFDELFGRSLYTLEFLDLGSRIETAAESINEYRDAPWTLVGALLLSILFRLVLAINTFVVAMGLGMDVSFVYFLLFVPLVEILLFVPLTLQGFGVRETSYAYLFAIVGAAPEAAAALGFTMAIVLGVVNNLIGGGIYLLDRFGVLLPTSVRE